MPKGSVKIMLSYNYNHFEVCLSSDEDMNLKEINEMRKDAQRLADEAVRQYQVSKEKASARANRNLERKELEKEVEHIEKNIPEPEWTAEKKAKIKALEDYEYWTAHNYDYDDDDTD